MGARVPLLCLLSFFLLAESATTCYCQSGDFDGNGVLNCSDLDQLTVAIREGSLDSTYDLSGDGSVNNQDVGSWLSGASTAFGYEIPNGDANLDGVVNARDANIASINYIWRTDPSPRPLGWCQADINGDGFSDAADKGVWASHWQMGRTLERPNAVTTKHEVVSSAAWSDPNGSVFASTSDYDIIAIPQKAPDGFLSTVLAFRQKDATHRFTTFEGLKIGGDVHQVDSSLSGGFGVTTRYDWEGSAGGIYDLDWAQFDSYLLWDPLTTGVYWIKETNDASDPVDKQASISPLPNTAAAQLGLGSLEHGTSTDGTFIHWNDDETFFKFAKIVTPAQMPTTGEPGEVSLRINLHSSDANSVPVPEVGFIGVDEPLQIPFLTRPCDVDTDGDCDLTDLDSMLNALGRVDPQYDIDQSGGPITIGDLRLWSDYADEIDVSDPVQGDSNFDGRVDAIDLNAVGQNWLAPGNYGWAGGDFDGNGVANAADLNVIGRSWQSGVSPEPSPVPEPSTSPILLITVVFMIARHRTRHV